MRPTDTIFDMHVHLLDEPVLDSDFLSFARQWNIQFAVSCLGTGNTMLTDPTVNECIECNDKVLSLMEKNVDFVHGFCYVSPVHGHNAVKEVRRCISHGMVGIKLWVSCKCSDPRAFAIIEEAMDLDKPILQHSFFRFAEVLPGESNPYDVALAASHYPDAHIVMAHMGFKWKQGVDAVRDTPNVMVDTCGFDPEMGCVEYAVEKLGAERVLYGSDAPLRDVLCQIGKVVSADISQEDRQKIFNSNARKLLKLAGAQ